MVMTKLVGREAAATSDNGVLDPESIKSDH